MRRKKWGSAYRAITCTFITLNVNTGKKKLKALKYIVLFLDTVKTIPHKLRTMRMPFSSQVLLCLCFDLQTNKQNKSFISHAFRFHAAQLNGTCHRCVGMSQKTISTFLFSAVLLDLLLPLYCASVQKHLIFTMLWLLFEILIFIFHLAVSNSQRK